MKPLLFALVFCAPLFSETRVKEEYACELLSSSKNTSARLSLEPQSLKLELDLELNHITGYAVKVFEKSSKRLFYSFQNGTSPFHWDVIFSVQMDGTNPTLQIVRNGPSFDCTRL